MTHVLMLGQCDFNSVEYKTIVTTQMSVTTKLLLRHFTCHVCGSHAVTSASLLLSHNLI